MTLKEIPVSPGPRECLESWECRGRREKWGLREILVRTSPDQRVKLERRERKDQMEKLGIREQKERLEQKEPLELLERRAMLVNQEMLGSREIRVLMV